MKKVLLYYPRISGETDSKTLYTGLPLAVLALAAQLDASAYDVRVIDGRLDGDALASCADWMDDGVLCAGISAMTSYQIRDGLTLARNIKDRYPGVPVVWGGWHPSLMPEQTIGHELIDIVVRGQGEFTFRNLVSQLAAGGELGRVTNLVYKDKKGNIVDTGFEPSLKMSDTRPIEYGYRYVDVENYVQPLWGNQRVVGYESSRGCPWHCSFCSIGSVYNRRWNALSPERVVNGLEYLYKNHAVDAVHFFDNNFFVDPVRVRRIAEQLVEKNVCVRWDGTSTVDQVLGFSDDYIDRLKRGGFYRVIVGAESGDEEVLRSIGKRHNNRQVLDMVAKCTGLDIQVSLSFMVGFPWDPEKDFNSTIKLIEAVKEINNKTEILLFIFSPYYGTELYDVALENGMTFPQDLEGWADFTYDKINTPWISRSLRQKMNRYISFFGTKDMSEKMASFVLGGKH